MFCERQDSVQREAATGFELPATGKTSKLLRRRRTRSSDACETMWEFRDSGTGPLESTDLCPTTCPRTRGCRGIFSPCGLRRDFQAESAEKSWVMRHTNTVAPSDSSARAHSQLRVRNDTLLGLFKLSKSKLQAVGPQGHSIIQLQSNSIITYCWLPEFINMLLPL